MHWMASLARTRGLSLGLAVAMLLGAGVRLFLYTYNSSLTEDEVSISLNIAMRGYTELLEELDLHQTAPVGFLWVERLAVTNGPRGGAKAAGHRTDSRACAMTGSAIPGRRNRRMKIWLSPGGMSPGICKLICVTPSTSPGAAPAK
jgi:hypothetical protein